VATAAAAVAVSGNCGEAGAVAAKAKMLVVCMLCGHSGGGGGGPQQQQQQQRPQQADMVAQPRRSTSIQPLVHQWRPWCQWLKAAWRHEFRHG